MNKQVPVHFDISKLKPVISEVGFDLHYNGVYNNYIKNVNEGTGDIPYNRAGEFLHRLYFENIREYRTPNLPSGRVEYIINLRYGSFDNFVKTMQDQVERIQGNGWLFMNSAGYLNIIPNNRIVDNIVMIIDCWEHAYAFTHNIDRASYIKYHLGIIDWEVVNTRIEESKKKKDQ